LAVTAASLVPKLRVKLGTIRPKEALQLETEADVDAALGDLLAASISHIEEFTHRTIIGPADAEARTFDGSGTTTLQITDFTALTAIAVDLDDDGVFEQALTGKVFDLPTDESIKTWLSLRRTAPLSRFPRAFASVQVTAKWGWPSLPPAVEDVILRASEKAYHITIQNRSGPLVQSGEFEVQIREGRVFTKELRDELQPWRRFAA
jgi:hypothetical protein